MASTISWTLISPPPATGGSGGSGFGGSSTNAPAVPCPVDAYTQQDLLDLFDRLLPSHYIQPLKSPGPGYEVLQMDAAVGARMSLAVERFGCAAFILSSTGGSFATGEVELYRAAINPEGIPTVVKAGTIVKSSRSGRRYQTTEDVTFGPNDLGPFTVAIQALSQGYEFNEPGTIVTPDGSVLAGEIDTVDVLVEDPDLGDPTIKVRQLVATGGGVDPALDEHGRDRGIPRGLGESDDSYRGRIRALPDNISPDAVDRALQQLLFPFGSTYAFLETYDITYQTCWDAPRDPIPGSNFDPNLFVYDDPDADATPFRNRWLDLHDMRGGFVVVVPNLPPIRDTSMAYDDTVLNADELTNAIGLRSVSAYDVPGSLGFGYLQGAWDGFDLPKRTTYKNVYNTLQSIKAAGAVAAVELQGQ